MSGSGNGGTLKSLENLFDKVNNEVDDSNNLETVRKEISIHKLVPYKNHKYKLYAGERLAAFVEDIKKNGVITPLIIRPIEGTDMCEVLAGHNRLNGATLAGLETVPYDLRNGLTEREALEIVHSTNLNQRSFNDLSYRERIDVIHQYYTELLEDKSEEVENENEEGADEENFWNLSIRQIRRYSKCSNLNDCLVMRLDNKEYSFRVAYNLAFLLDAEQTLLDEILTKTKFKIDDKKSESLKKQVGHLNESRIIQILEGNKKTRNGKEAISKLSKELISRHFSTKKYTNTEIEEILSAALKMYFEGVANE